MGESKHTPGPWGTRARDQNIGGYAIFPSDVDEDYCHAIVPTNRRPPQEVEANARLIAAAPNLLEALLNVRKIISEAAMTGFNCKDSDWPERLFASQQVTSAAIAKATKATS